MLRNQCPLIDDSGIGLPGIASLGRGMDLTTLSATVTIWRPILGSFMNDEL
jgi:hypothetical protein